MKKPIPFGKYVLLERINVGGMAEVFKAKAFGVEGFERLVAVKRILPSIAEDQEFITMFIDEAKIAVQLTHANIAQIFDLGKVGDSYFIAMEFVHGKDLRAIFDRARKRGEAVPVPMACYTAMKVCEGLDYAHNKKDAAGRELNLVHRDVSPQNILISYDGESKIIDFGIAKAAGKAGKTQAGILKGKFGYMSPEQVRGLPLDRRSDIFAVGIVLYELLTGERLFVGESDFSTLEKVRNVEIMPPSTYNRRIPEELEQIVLKALAKDVDDRYQTAMDLHDDLQSFMYTSGNFFSRKDLSAYMRKAFAEEIAKESAREEEYRKMEAEAAKGGSGLDAFADLEPAPAKAANISPPQPRPPAPPRPVKKTVMGMGAVPPPPPPRTSGAPPPPPRQSVPGAPAAERPERRPAPARAARAAPADLRAELRRLARHGLGRRGAVDPDLRQARGRHHAGDPGRGGGRGAGPVPAVARAGPARPRAELHEAGRAEHARLHARAVLPVRARLHAGRSLSLRRSARGAAGAAPARPRADRRHAQAGGRRRRRHRRRRRAARGGLARGGRRRRLVLLPARAAGHDPPHHDAPGRRRLPRRPARHDVHGEPLRPRERRAGRAPARGAQARLQHVGHADRARLGADPADAARDADRGGWHPAGDAGGHRDRRHRHAARGGRAGTGFSLDTVPSGANVFVDDNQLPSTTPVTVTDLAPGTHTIRAELTNYAPWTGQIEVQPSQIVQLPRAVLTLRQVSVRFDSTPSGARVTLVRGSERRNIGETPVTSAVETSGGAWTVEMTRAGHEDWSSPLTPPSGQAEHTVTATLVERARVAVRGGGRRDPPVRDTGGGGGTDTPTRVESGGGGPGTLRVNTTPWSQVFVDGRLIGNTPQMNISLPAGRYTITLVNRTSTSASACRSPSARGRPRRSSAG
ncbi:MAG: protein kinase [Sandaracinaceae bacterium]|nr:protein kinase [Sandaracinaceae bacterium]